MRWRSRPRWFGLKQGRFSRQQVIRRSVSPTMRRSALVKEVVMHLEPSSPQVTAHPVPESWRRTAMLVAGGVLGSLVLGSLARGWMRLISEDPEFTWSGTMFIVIGFTFFGLTQSVAAAARRRSGPRWAVTIARVFGAIGMLPLFMAAGGMMMPTVVGAGLAKARVDWPRPLRAVLLLVAAGPVAYVLFDLIDTFGWSVRTCFGFVLLVALYSVIVWATDATMRPVADGWRLSTRAKVLVTVGSCALILVPVVLGGIN